jgi:hypothetical protein
MNDDIPWLDYFVQVAKMAKQLGYNTEQVLMFKEDIRECWLDHKSVEEAVIELF